MLLREFSTVILSPSQSHYFPRELQAIPLLQLTYCNHCKMRLHHKLAGNVPLHSTHFSVPTNVPIVWHYWYCDLKAQLALARSRESDK